MAEKILNTRIQLKYDTWENWNTAIGRAIVLKKGEIGLCEISSGNTQATTAPTVLFKVGDGVTSFGTLQWASAKAADVYSWAKCSDVELDGNVLKFHNNDKTNPVYSIDLSSLVPDNIIQSIIAGDKSVYINNTDSKNPTVAINFADEADGYNVVFTVDNGGVHGNVNRVPEAEIADKVANTLTLKVAGTTKATFNGAEAATVNITAADLGLSSAMTFLGISTTAITDGGTEAPTIDGTSIDIEDITSGSVVLYSGKEFVLVGRAAAKMWELLGDEGSYALKTVTITGNDGLTGGGSLAENRTIGIADGGVTTTKIADANVTGAKIAEATIEKSHLSTDLADWIRNQVTTETASLANIAKTGNVLDLVQDTGDVLVFNCGSATVLVENTTTGYKITIINPANLVEQYSTTVAELGTWADLITKNVEFTSLKSGTVTLIQDSSGKVTLSDGRYICVPNQTIYPAADKYIMAVDDIYADWIYEIEFQAS